MLKTNNFLQLFSSVISTMAHRAGFSSGLSDKQNISVFFLVSAHAGPHMITFVRHIFIFFFFVSIALML